MDKPIKIRHELFAIKLIIRLGNQTKAYQDVYKCKYSSARTQGCLLARKIRWRVREILDRGGRL